MARPIRAMTLALAAVLGATGLSAQDFAPYEVEGRKSGYLFMSEAIQTLQDDEFANPAYFAVDMGRTLWDRAEGPAGLSCASCHGAAEEAMRGVATRYPMYDAEAGTLLNLELRINRERTERMGVEPFEYESDELLGLTAFVSLQSRGMPVDVNVDGPAAEWFDRGKDFYEEKRGQLDLACNQCHDLHVGRRLRGDIISQGQTNAFPIFRLLWNSVGSRHRMFAWCNIALRAEPFPLGSEEYLALELYVAWRGRGLPIEAPGVRR